MLPEEILRNLEEAKQLAEQSNHNINEFINTLSDHALKLITQIYADDLQTLEGNGFRELNDAISHSLTSLSIKVNNIIFNNRY